MQKDINIYYTKITASVGKYTKVIFLVYAPFRENERPLKKRVDALFPKKKVSILSKEYIIKIGKIN